MTERPRPSSPWCKSGVAPASRIEGAGVDLDGNAGRTPSPSRTPNGGFTTAVPALDDSSLDSDDGFRADTALDPALTSRYLEVLGAIAHEPSALSLPGVACRLGGFAITEAFSDSRLIPFDDMSAEWKNYGQYQACMAQHVQALSASATGLYDAAFAPDAAEAKPLIK